MNTTRKNLYIKIHKTLGLSKNISSKIIDDFFDLFSNELIKKEKIKIHSFGTFQVINKKERIGRNPKTGTEHTISARNTISFIASKILKKQLNSK